MIFNSLSYFLFLPIVFSLFFIVAHRYRWMVLLVASIGFYAALKLPYLLMALFLITVCTYWFGLRIGPGCSSGKRNLFFWSGVATNLIVLCSLKYLPYLVKKINSFLSDSTPELSLPVVPILVTIGVSYYSFQAISYLIDIYLEVEEPETHFGLFALYLNFFPKLLQGPIERSGDLLPQLKVPYEFNYDNMRSGLLLFTWGLFKKVVIADRLALFVNMVYDDVHSYSGLSLVVATYFYAFQIYFDFSGYTDMALGTARLFNIKLTQNFNSPYLATSIADFWRRWHISFSRWILDYIFKPLQMQFRDWKTWGTAAALLVTFIISGIWHGANWGFVVWGLLHGLYLSCSVLYKPFQKKIYKWLGIEKTGFLKVWQTAITFHLVCIAWIFFRANTVADGMYVLTNLFTDGVALSRLFREQKPDIAILLFMAVVLMAVHFIKKKPSVESRFYGWNPILRWPVYITLVVCSILFNVKSDKLFIYFKF